MEIPSRWMLRGWMRLRAFVRGTALDHDLDEELRFHVEQRIAADVARGISPEDARRAALAAFGGIEQRKEECRDARGVRPFEDVLQDARYALRTLRRAPLFATAAILTIGAGIGLTVAMFTVVHGVLLRPLPFPEPERLFLVALSPRSLLMQQPGMADRSYVTFRERDRSFQHLAAFTTVNGNLTGAGDPAVIPIGNVTTEFFDALAVTPALGRTFAAGDGEEGREPVLVMGDALWRGRFGSDPAIVGRSVTINGIRRTVVGVMPPGFDFPAPTAAWTPHVVRLQQGNSMLFPVLGRLRPGISMPDARAAFETLVTTLPDGPKPDERARWTVALLPLEELLVGNVRWPLQVFAGAVLLVLLVACANVANLLLARGAGRDREMTMRATLGASRRRLVRQLLVESAVLSFLGAAVGVVAGWWTVILLLRLAPPGRIPRMDMIRMDGAVIAFAIAAAAVTALMFGLAPALRLTRRPSRSALAAGARSFGGGQERFRAALVIAEIAVALVLIAGAGMMARSFLQLRSVDPGFRTDHVVRLSLELPPSRYATPAALHAFHREMLNGLAALPDVAAAGVVNWLPLGNLHLNGDFSIEGWADQPAFNVDKTTIGGGYFRAMGIRLLGGREFDDRDRASGPGTVIVSRTVARTIDPSENVIGKRISVWGGRARPNWLTVVGVVDDIRQSGPSGTLRPAVYQPYSQIEAPFLLSHMTYVVRTASDPAAAIPRIRNVLRVIDRDQPAVAIGLMTDALDAATAEPAFYARLLGTFAVLAVLLAVVGTYGVIAYSVAERSHEIGVRMALGARSGSVVWLVVRRTLLLASAGVAIGTAAAWMSTRLLESFLFEIRPTDPATFTAVALTVFLAAMLAGVLPARRATRVDPVVALRHD